MATDQQFCLRWNNHQSTLISVFDSLLENGTLVDCTLAAEGQYLKAHKVVLSACSPYLETLLSQHYEKHPIVILKDVKFTELKSMMDYMYRGEVNISQDQLGTFLKAAESLQIKGLSDNGDDARDVGSTTTTKRQETPSRPAVTQVRTPLEPKRPAPSGDLSDASRDGSISPSSLRKRRRTRRPSQGDDPDSHLDNTSNSCDLPSQAQSTPLPVPSSNVVPTPVQNLPKQIKQEQPSSISRLDSGLNSSIAPESGLLKEKIEPPNEPLLEPKTEYLDYMNNENSIEVEDLTLDDDEEDLDSSMDASRAGPSHGDMSNSGYPPWQMTGDQSGTDEIFMAAQEAVGAASQQQRDSQDANEPEVGRRRSSRARTTSEQYVSVEIRQQSHKSRRRGKKSGTERRQESENKSISGSLSSSPAKNITPSKSPKKKSPNSVKKTSQRPKRTSVMKIKTEPFDEPSTSTSQTYPSLPSIHDDLALIQQSIKKEPEDIKLKIEPEEENNTGDDDKMNPESTEGDDVEKLTPNKQDIQQNIILTSNGNKCGFCGRVYKYRKGLLQHQRLECGQEPQFPCPYCPLRFRYRHQIRNHVYNAHNQAFKRWYYMYYAASKLSRW